MADFNQQILAALKARAGGMFPLAPGTLDPNATQAVPTTGRLPTNGGGLTPSTLSTPSDTAGQAATLPTPPNLSDPSLRRTGIKSTLAEVGLGLLGGTKLAESYANAPRERAMQQYELDRQHSLDVSGEAEKAATAAHQKALADTELANASKVPVTLRDGSTAYVRQEDVAKMLGTQDTNTTRQGIADEGNATKKTIAESGDDTKKAIADQTNQTKETIADKTLAERQSEFKATLGYKQWKEKLDNDTKQRTGQLNANKAPAAVIQTAEFANGGLQMMSDAESSLDRLEKSKVLGNVATNKLEDWLFGNGVVDPTLDAQTKKDIGALRAALGYTSSAAMRAHTGRTSKDIYDDFKTRLGLGQGLDALHGALDETHKLLTDYSQAASDASIASIRAGTSTPGTKSPSASTTNPSDPLGIR